MNTSITAPLWVFAAMFAGVMVIGAVCYVLGHVGGKPTRNYLTLLEGQARINAAKDRGAAAVRVPASTRLTELSSTPARPFADLADRPRRFEVNPPPTQPHRVAVMDRQVTGPRHAAWRRA